MNILGGSEFPLREPPAGRIQTAMRAHCLCRCEMADGGFVRLVAWEEGSF